MELLEFNQGLQDPKTFMPTIASCPIRLPPPTKKCLFFVQQSSIIQIIASSSTWNETRAWLEKKQRREDLGLSLSVKCGSRWWREKIWLEYVNGFEQQGSDSLSKYGSTGFLLNRLKQIELILLRLSNKFLTKNGLGRIRFKIQFWNRSSLVFISKTLQF